MTSHPDFDDQGAVFWHADFEAARAEAAKAGKGLLVQVGRYECGGCRALVEEVVPRPEVRSYLGEHFVCLADDADGPAPQVVALVRSHLPAARALPIVLLTDAEGRWLGGGSGPVSAEGFLGLLRSAVSKMQA